MTVVGAVGFLGVLPAWTAPSRGDRPLASAARRASLNITVSERGNVESCVTVDGICELNGYQNKIIVLVPEGTKVKKGDIVCKFDGSEIQKNLAQQDIRVKQAVSKIETTKQEMEIQRNKNESDIMAAKVELSLAELDLRKYKEGDYPAEITKQKGEISLKEKELEEAKSKLEQYKALMKKGFKTPEEIRVMQIGLEGKKQELSSTTKFLDVKERFELERKTTEYTSKVEQSRKKLEQAIATARAQMLRTGSEFDAAKATAEIEQQQLKEFLTQKEKTVIKAEQAGIVAYSNDRYWDPSSQIREGATVYSRQKVFTLPDMSHMQVKVNIHESLIKKIKPGQKAEVRIDAFPSGIFVGTVKSVSQLADSTKPWMTAGIKEYTTIVTIDELLGFELKPGMTAETRIFVGELKDVLVVPLQAIGENKGEFFAFVDEAGTFRRRKVKIGETNEKLVEVREGLKEGEELALDARLRIAAELKAAEAREKTDPGAVKEKEGTKSNPSSQAR